MVGEVIAGLGAFKTMFDIAKSMKDMSDAVARNAAVAELWEQILSAQARYSAAVEQIRELEAKVASFEAWERQKQRYRLKDFGGGTFAYELKPEEAQGEPPHRICAHCYESGHRSVLQFSAKSGGQDYFDCLRCKTRQAFGIFRSSLDDDYGDWQSR